MVTIPITLGFNSSAGLPSGAFFLSVFSTSSTSSSAGGRTGACMASTSPMCGDYRSIIDFYLVHIFSNYGSGLKSCLFSFICRSQHLYAFVSSLLSTVRPNSTHLSRLALVVRSWNSLVFFSSIACFRSSINRSFCAATFFCRFHFPPLLAACCRRFNV